MKRRRGARLGQHFLTRPEVAGWVADALPLATRDTVLEIGPGHGILTRELLKRAGKVIAVEKESTLVAELRVTFATELMDGRLLLVNEDVRDFEQTLPELESYVLVANIPYYLTGYIIRSFLSTAHQPSAMALLVQKEVAERIIARDGKESILSLSVKAYGTPELVRVVKAGAFSPAPAVDSAILRIEGISRSGFEDETHERRFFELVRAGFGKKRKRLAANIAHLVTPESFAACGVPLDARAETLTVATWRALCR